MQDEVFTQVPDTMLLQGVDAQQLASIQFQADSLLPDQSDHQQLQDISLEDYASLHQTVVQSSPSYQTSHGVNQDLQAVLNSPLPESLADFSTFHASSNMEIESSNFQTQSPSYQTQSPSYQTQSPVQYVNSPHTSLATQSPLQSPLIRHDSPGFAYPTPPASHDGQSPCFSQNTILPMVSPKHGEFGQVSSRDLDEPPQASSPLSAAFFTSTMSSSAAVEEALEEVLPGETINGDEFYPSLTNSPPPQSPISVGLTPVASPMSNIPPTTIPTTHPQTTPPSSSNSIINFIMSPQYTFQTQMLPNSDDPLLSSSPKDFVQRKKFEFNGLPLKVISNNGLIDLNSANFAGILVDANGELKFIQTGGGNLHGKNILLTGAPFITTQSALVKDEEGGKGGVRIHKILKTVQTVIPTKPQVQKVKSSVECAKQDEPNDVFLSPTT